MSRIKDYLIDLQEQRQNEITAKKLGLTYEELEKYLEAEGDDKSDDGLLYGYYFHFKDDMPQAIRAKIPGLDRNNSVYVDPYFFDDETSFYEDQYEAILDVGPGFAPFAAEFDNLRKLNEIDTGDEQLNAILKRQLFIAAVGTMETFLSTTFVSRVLNDDILLKRYVETTPAFKVRKFDLAHIYTTMGSLKEIAKQEMLDVIYHNLPVVREMYHCTFAIDVPSISDVAKCVSERHHLVHRNGKTKDGEVIIIDASKVEDVIIKTSQFCEALMRKLTGDELL